MPCDGIGNSVFHNAYAFADFLDGATWMVVNREAEIVSLRERSSD